MKKYLKPKAGDWVEIRSKEEILQTLDKKGQLDGLPFMAEMFQYCGKRFQVYKRAHKTCDTVYPVRGRRMGNAVHLETRCDGQAHGGCQAGCLLFWKEAWLKRVHDGSASQAAFVPDAVSRCASSGTAGACTEQDVWAGTQAPMNPGEKEPSYVCQATQLPAATTALAWWDLRQYLEDYRSANVGLWTILKGLTHAGYYHLTEAGIGVGRVMRWFYDNFYPLWRGTPWPRKTGTIPAGKPTPTQALNLQPGEFVRVKSHEAILRTLDTSSKNRGMTFDKEMVPYCGGIHRVLRRVTTILDERTGKMQQLKTPCIILESAVCQARYSDCRLFCPRSIYPYWREIWLERVSGSNGGAIEAKEDKSSH